MGANGQGILEGQKGLCHEKMTIRATTTTTTTTGGSRVVAIISLATPVNLKKRERNCWELRIGLVRGVGT